MVDLATLEGRQVLLAPLSLDHVPTLVEAATRSRTTYDLTDERGTCLTVHSTMIELMIDFWGTTEGCRL